MDYQITHLPTKNRFVTTVDGVTAHVEYSHIDGTIDIIHTIVPRAIEGRGVAAALVKEAIAFADANGLKVEGSCSYAATYLRRIGRKR